MHQSTNRLFAYVLQYVKYDKVRYQLYDDIPTDKDIFVRGRGVREVNLDCFI